MDKDYYKILGVCESDSAEVIKRAYRTLARKWHPDVAGNTKDALARFKEINEAYEVLSDISKKNEYDKARNFYNYAKNGTNYTTSKNNATNPNAQNTSDKDFSSSSYFKNFSKNIDEWFYNKKSENKTNTPPTPKRGEDVYTDVEISVMEAINGVQKIINMLQTKTCSKCGGRKFINGALCPYCSGKGEESQYKKFNIKIPAGIKNGAKIRLSGEGANGINGGANGDLYITVKIKENEYKTDGLNIIKTVYITPEEAVLGANIVIKTINGSYNIIIPSNTQNGQKIRLSGCGIVQNEKVGDMIIILEIRIPKTLSKEEIELYKKLSKISSHNIRDSIYE